MTMGDDGALGVRAHRLHRDERVALARRPRLLGQRAERRVIAAARERAHEAERIGARERTQRERGEAPVTSEIVECLAQRRRVRELVVARGR